MSTSATQSPFKLSRTRTANAAGNDNRAASSAHARAAEMPPRTRVATTADTKPLQFAETRTVQSVVGTSAVDRPTSDAISSGERLHLLHHPIGDHVLTALRNRRTPSDQFRIQCQRLLLLLAVEATRSLPVRQRGPGADATGRTLGKPVVVLSLSRDGLGLAHQMAECIPESTTGVVTVHGTETDRPEPRLHLVRAPALSDARVLLFAPIIATGLSGCLALSLLRHSGATDISIISIVVSAEGLARIQSLHPATHIWTGAVDAGWDPKIGPAPGIGNFAERMYS